jgi:hypothetical protein
MELKVSFQDPYEGYGSGPDPEELKAFSTGLTVFLD